MADVVDFPASLLGNMVEDGGEFIGGELVPWPVPEFPVGGVQGGVAAAEFSPSCVGNPNVEAVIGENQW